jgi:WD40 repeat protein
MATTGVEVTSGVLAAYARALGREAHALARSPDLLWPQLHNRLQWEGSTVEAKLAPERSRRSQPTAGPWLRLATPYREPRALLHTLTGQTGDVQGCAFSPDGRRIVSASHDGTLTEWDGATGLLLRTVIGQAGSVCAFSPDGRRIVSGGNDGRLKVWDIENGAELRALTGHADSVTWPGAIMDCAFSPDGRRIVSASHDGTLKVWDTDTGVELRTLNPGTGSVVDCGFSPDGGRIVSASLWGDGAHTGVSRGVAFSPDGRRIVASGGNLMMWDANSGAVLRTFRRTLASHQSGALDTWELRPDGQMIHTNAEAHTLSVWDISTGDELYALGQPRSPQGGFGSGLQWDAESGFINRGNRPGHTAPVRACAFSPDERRIVSASADHTLRIWDAGTGDLLSTLIGHTGPVWALAFSPDGRRIVSASADHTLKVWDADSGAEQEHRAGHTDRVWDCAFSPDGRRIVSASADHSLKVWDADSGAELRTVSSYPGPHGTHAISFTDCAFSAHGHRIVSARREWDADSGAELRVLPGFSDAWDLRCAFSPDERRIVSGSQDGTPKVWDIGSGAVLHTLAGHTGRVQACAFSPDGRRIVCASDDHTLKVWDTGSGAVLHTLAGHTGRVQACAFSPDGHRIVSASDDHTLRVWNAADGGLVAYVEFPGAMLCASWHPWLPRVTCGDESGVLYRVEVVGIELGPIVVIATERGPGLVVRCPACQSDHPLQQAELGSDVICPTEGCSLNLRINQFFLPDLRR